MSAEPAAKAGEAAPSAATEPATIAAAFEYFIFSNPFPRRCSPPSTGVTSRGRTGNPGFPPFSGGPVGVNPRVVAPSTSERPKGFAESLDELVPFTPYLRSCHR
jgi:hypothetical protein